MSQTFIKIDSLSATPWNFKTNLSYEPVKNPRYNIHGLTLSANFSKLTWTIHICRTSTFQCENVQCFTFKRCDKLKIKVLVMEVCIVRIILEKFTWRQNSECCSADFFRVVSEICKKGQKVQILNEVAPRQVVRKGVSCQDRKNENTPKFPGIKIRYHAAFWRYLKIIWVICITFLLNNLSRLLKI